jgi:superfamily II DNA or RNA helicase
MYVLEPFQATAKASIATRFKQYKRVLLQSATGSGKTVIAVDFIKDWLDENPGKTVLVLLKLQCLVPQFEASFAAHGMRDEISILHDTITRARDGTRLVDHGPGCTRRILVSMPETYVGVMEERAASTLQLCPEFEENIGLIVIDEAHQGTSENFQKIRDAYDAYVLGLTATPMRVKNKEGECLANDWAYELVVTVSIEDLIAMGRLCQPLYYDLDEDAHLYYEWKKAADKHSEVDGNRQTIWFVKDTAMSKDWEAKLLEMGETVRVITSVDDEDLGTTSQTPNQREAIYKEFENQEVTHLISVKALCEGFDAPIAKFCVIDRGVGNRALYQQIIGRVIRAYPGKENGHIIDRCGNHSRHGDIEEYVWDLEADAADSVVVNLADRRVIDHEKAERATKIKVKCSTYKCPSVYNAKKHLSCPHCNEAHNIEVEAPAVAWLALRFPQFNEKVYPNLIDTFTKGLKGDMTALTRLMNSVPDLFDDETGNLNPKYAMMPAICKLGAKNLKQKVRIAA